MRKLILIFTLLFVAKNIFGQSPHSPFSFRQLIDDKGALSNISYCFLEDRDGFLWIGTDDGLKRYDGHDFKVFKHEATKSNTLINNDVETICEDKLGRIWIGTGEGICYFDKKSNQFSNLNGFDKSENVCYTIVCDEAGDIWFTLRGRGLFHYIEKTKKVVNFSHNVADKSSISSKKIRQKGLLFDPAKNGIWIDTVNGINFFDFATQQFYHKENNPKNLTVLQSDHFQGLAIDRDNLIFFDKEAQKLNYYSLAKQQIIREVLLKNNQARPINIQCIFVDNKHNLWLSDWNSFCYHFDTKTTDFFELTYDASKPTSISSTFFWCAYQQKDGNIWLGTDNGISIVNPDRDFYEIYDIALLFPPLKARNWVYTFNKALDKLYGIRVLVRNSVNR